MKYFSMFTGVGGFELGIQKAHPDWECVGFSEIDKYANIVMEKRFRGLKNYGDATKINTKFLPDFDMLCGGFPCQTFSIAGKRKGFSDTRGTLFFEIAKIIEAKRPKIVFLENVKGLLNHEDGKTFSTIIKVLGELGYNVQWMVLNSKFFGVPQNRERVFIIGNIRGEPRSEILPFKEQDKIITKRLQKKRKTAHCVTARNPSRSLNDATLVKAVLTPYREIKRQNGRRFKEEGEPMFTLTNQDIHGLEIGEDIRQLTPLEFERLQGFPDDWTLVKLPNGKMMSDTQRYKMMGNAVTVNVIEAIARKLK